MNRPGAKASDRRTPSYLELTARIRELEAERAAVRDREVAEVIARMRETIELYGITAAELGFSTSPHNGLGNGRQGPRPPKYADGQGRTWSGLGPRPRWLKEALASGRSEHDLRVPDR
jgi:DNA-binding protein H-NS